MIPFLADIPKVLSAVIYLADEAYVGLIGVFWYFLVKFGLQPSYSFPDMGSNIPLMGFYSFLFNNLYVEFASIAIVFAAMILMFTSYANSGRAYWTIVSRFSVSVILFVGSMEITQFIIGCTSYAFDSVWSYGSINWYSLLSVTNISSNLITPVSQVSASNSLVEFFLLSWLFVATFSLMSMLIVRQAIMIFLSLILPLFSLLFMTDSTSKLPVKLWILYIESSILPFFVMIILVLVHIFYYDFLLQIGFLSLAVLLPTVLMSNSLVYRFSSFQSMYGEMSAGSVLSGIGTQGGYIRAIMSGDSSVSSAGNMLSYPLWNKDKGSSGPLKVKDHSKAGIDWKKIEDEKLKYRREW
ncbi:MAG: hypothetical protein QW597_05475 [Thermoplasmataceae archaeon]